jgi:hypothetical protein
VGADELRVEAVEDAIAVRIPLLHHLYGRANDDRPGFTTQQANGSPATTVAESSTVSRGIGTARIFAFGGGARLVCTK